VINTNDGLATLSLSFSYPVAFTYRLKPQDENLESKHLSRFVLQEMTDHSLTYFIRPPAPGNYLLTIFAREFLDGVSPKTMITFRSVAEYKVVCDCTSDEVTSPFPYCSDSSWGLDMYASFIGSRLIPNHRTAVVFCPDGSGSVSLQLADSDLRFYARLVREGLAFDVLKLGVTVAQEDSQVVIQVELPEPGEYGLEVFVNDPDKDGKLFAHFCQYLFTTDVNGNFASAYKASQDVHEVDEETEDGDLIAVQNQSDIVEDKQETEAVIVTESTTETMASSEQADQDVPEEQQDDETGVEQQVVEGTVEVAEETSTQQVHTEILETKPAPDEQETESADKDQECVETAEVDEHVASEEIPPRPEVTEEDIAAVEHREAQHVPASTLDDHETDEESKTDEAGKDEVKNDELTSELAAEVSDEVAESDVLDVDEAAEHHEGVEKTDGEPVTSEESTETLTQEEETAKLSADEPKDNQECLKDQEEASEELAEVTAEDQQVETVTEVLVVTQEEQNVKLSAPADEPKGNEECLKDQEQASEELTEVSVEDQKVEVATDVLVVTQEEETAKLTGPTDEPKDNQDQEEASEESAEVSVEGQKVENIDKSRAVDTTEDQVSAEELQKDEIGVEQVKVDQQESAEEEPKVSSEVMVKSEKTETIETIGAVADQQVEDTDGGQDEQRCTSEENEEVVTDVPHVAEQVETTEDDVQECEELKEEERREDEQTTEEPKYEARTEEMKSCELTDVVAEANVETEEAEVVKVGVATDQKTPEEPNEDQGTVDDQITEEPKGQLHEEEVKGNEEQTSEESTGVLAEANMETVETRAEVCHETPQEPSEDRDRSDEQRVEEVGDQPCTDEIINSQEITSEESAEVVQVMTEKTEQPDNVEPEDIQAIEPEKDECLEMGETSQQEDSSAVASVESQKTEVHVVEDEQMPEQPERDEGVEDKACEQTDEEPKEDHVECGQKSASEESPEVVSEVKEDQQADMKTVETGEPSVKEELVEVSVEESVRTLESGTSELKTADVQEERATSEVSTQDEAVVAEEGKPGDSDSVVAMSEDATATKEPAAEHECATGVDLDEQKPDTDNCQLQDSSSEQHECSAVAVVEHSKPADDTDVCQEHQMVSEAAPTNDIEVSTVKCLFNYLLLFVKLLICPGHPHNPV